MNSNILQVRRLGRVPYAPTWELQRQLQQDLIHERISQTIVFCEHNPAITIGRSGNDRNVLRSREELAGAGVEVFEVERGGDVTYHGPGQLVAYPIIDLKLHRRDVGWYMRSLEEVMIRTLQDFDIKGVRIPGKTGVWTQPLENVINFGRLEPHKSLAQRKIAALGVRISRWCTMHGASLNVTDCREGFALINPCGFTDIEVTSLEQELGPSRAAPSLESVMQSFLAHFKAVFEFAASEEVPSQDGLRS